MKVMEDAAIEANARRMHERSRPLAPGEAARNLLEAALRKDSDLRLRVQKR